MQQFFLLDGRQRGGHSSALPPVGSAISIAIPPPEPAAAARLASVIRCLHHDGSLAGLPLCGHAAPRAAIHFPADCSLDESALVARGTMDSRARFALTLGTAVTCLAIAAMEVRVSALADDDEEPSDGPRPG